MYNGFEQDLQALSSIVGTLATAVQKQASAPAPAPTPAPVQKQASAPQVDPAIIAKAAADLADTGMLTGKADEVSRELAAAWQADPATAFSTISKLASAMKSGNSGAYIGSTQPVQKQANGVKSSDDTWNESFSGR